MSSMAAADYLWYLRTAARHFWSGAIEQQMLWYSYEPSPGDVRTRHTHMNHARSCAA
jgi:hypothetical protein